MIAKKRRVNAINNNKQNALYRKTGKWKDGDEEINRKEKTM